MRILTRYLLRLHLGPFVYALTALTALMLLDQVSKQFGALVGKGLGGRVILQVFLLSVPFIIALILPMAVLVAVLYTFNRLAADNEITAMRAGGISFTRLLTPLLLVATLLAGGLVWFNDTVLPESNHRLQVLLSSIGRKKPTFTLRERTINKVLPGRLYLQAQRIDPGTSRLYDVTIYDERAEGRSRTFYADSGRVAYNRTQTDLFLTLFDGVMHERKESDRDKQQQVFFRSALIRVAGVGNELEQGELGNFRGDREMPIGEMRKEEEQNRKLAREARTETTLLTLAVTRYLLGLPTDSAALVNASSGVGLAAGRDSAVARDSAAGRDSAPAQGPADGTLAAATTVPAASDSMVRRLAGRIPELRTASAAAMALKSRSVRHRLAEHLGDTFGVEIQKKFSIPAACIVFVLIGAPIAIRYRRGGVGLVVGVSFGVFSAYYVSLIGGEHLADKSILSPFWAMWGSNVLFGSLGVWLVWRTRRAGGG